MRSGVTQREKRYVRLLSTLRQRCGLPQRRIAMELGISESSVSRLLTGRALCSLVRLVGLLKTLGARDSEIRVGLALAMAVKAEREGSVPTAEYLDRMFEPLFLLQSFVQHVNSPSNIAANVCRALAIPVDEDMEVALARLSSADWDSDLGIVGHLARIFDRSNRALRFADIERLRRTFCDVVGVCFADPWIEEAPEACSTGWEFSVVRGKVRRNTLERIPQLHIAIVDLDGDSLLEVRGGSGIEFLFVCRGQGRFQMRDSEQVSVATDGRRLLGYVPKGKRTVEAAAMGLEVAMVEYLKDGETNTDPIGQVVEQAVGIPA